MLVLWTLLMSGNMVNLHFLDANLILLAATAILIIGAMTWLYVRQRRSRAADLRKEFVPECDRAELPASVETKEAA